MLLTGNNPPSDPFESDDIESVLAKPISSLSGKSQIPKPKPNKKTPVNNHSTVFKYNLNFLILKKRKLKNFNLRIRSYFIIIITRDYLIYFLLSKCHNSQG